MSVDTRMDRHIVVCGHPGRTASEESEQAKTTCNNVDESHKLHAVGKKPGAHYFMALCCCRHTAQACPRAFHLCQGPLSFHSLVSKEGQHFSCHWVQSRGIARPLPTPGASLPACSLHYGRICLHTPSLDPHWPCCLPSLASMIFLAL